MFYYLGVIIVQHKMNAADTLFALYEPELAALCTVQIICVCNFHRESVKLLPI